MKTPLAITGCQILTPLDDGTQTTWDAIRASKRVESQTAVPDHLLHGDPAWDRSIRLALSAARNLNKNFFNTSLFCGTSKGPAGTLLAAMEKLRHGSTISDTQARHVLLGVGAMGAYLSEQLQIQGPAHTSVAACSSGLHALHRAAAAIRQGACKRALVVAADSSLHPLFQASFERLGVIAPRNAANIRTCDPFGENGDGFFLIEAAAAIMLESPDHLEDRKPLAWLENSWIGGDSTDLIAIDAHTRTLRAGLTAVGGREDISFVHAHATGTGHDAYELAAIRAVCGEEAAVFSHKKWLGHSLGAAGLLSVALSTLCHQSGSTLTGTHMARNAKSLTIAQGFGGHVGVVALRTA